MNWQKLFQSEEQWCLAQDFLKCRLFPLSAETKEITYEDFHFEELGAEQKVELNKKNSIKN